MTFRSGEMGGAYTMHERSENCIQNFSRKPEAKRPLGRPMRKWEDDISMNLKKRGW